MLVAKSYCNTCEKDKYRISVYRNEPINAVIDTDCKMIRMDVIDIKSMMESLFEGLNPEQQKNMIKILEKTD